MIRPSRLCLVLAVLVAVPSAASAQRDTRETREATKFIGIAMTRQAQADKAEQYRQAMTHLRTAMQNDANNAKVWMLAGTALAGLGEIREADQAFTRAVELHPAYAEEIEGERESAWVALFNTGIEHMDAQRYAEAITTMESAQLIFPRRPEALLNLGALHANAGDRRKAEQALRDAIEVTNGSAFAQLNEEQKAEWVRYRALATSNIAQILSHQGIEEFQAERYDSAAAAFLRAAEVNPHARDYWFNHAQSLWAQATPLEEQLAAAPEAQKAALRTQLNELYGRIQASVEKARGFDPNNEALYLIGARTHRMAGEIAPAGPQREAAQQGAMRLLEQHDGLTVLLDEINVAPDEEGNATIMGKVKNAKLADGAPVTIRFTLLGVDGDPVGQQDVTVNVSAPQTQKDFEAETKVSGAVAGWRYTIGS